MMLTIVKENGVNRKVNDSYKHSCISIHPTQSQNLLQFLYSFKISKNNHKSSSNSTEKPTN